MNAYSSKKIKTLFRVISLTILVIIFSIACSLTEQDSSTSESKTTSISSSSSSSSSSSLAPTTLFLVGDSTVCEFNDVTYYYPRYGYGTKIGSYLKSNVTITNLALSGRSSKSFIIETNYTTLVNSIKSGDYLIIGFGHNDEKTELDRYTNPNTPITDPASFKYYLYNYYIKVAQEKGATPILCTPIVRRSATGTYTGEVVHVTTGTTEFPGGDYAQCIRDLGAELGVTVIDNTALTKTLHETTFASKGADGTAKFHAWTSSSIGSVDNTHTNSYGASYVAYLMANAIKSSNCSLKDYVLDSITPPEESSLQPNPDYQEPTYSPPTTKSTVWTTTDPWWGTVFGDCGGQSKITDGSYGITESGTTVTMRSGTTTAAAGKISSTTDGLAMYFQKLPINTNFTFTATATVSSIASNDQVSFGLMVRDAIWIDTFDASLVSSYVAAGPLKITKGAAAYSSFTRVYDTVTKTSTMNYTFVSSSSVIPTAGTVVNLSIVKTGNVYTVTYGSETPVNYTIDLNGIDTDYIYVGLYTARQCEVVFSNITLTTN